MEFLFPWMFRATMAEYIKAGHEREPMRTTKNFPLATFALLMLGTQEQGASVKSSSLSTLLGVSDSSLKKLMRQLVKAGLVVSTASRSGGYRLARPLAQITLADVLAAVEGSPVLETPDTSLAACVFDDQEGVEAAQRLVGSTFERCEDALMDELSSVTLDQFLKEGGAARLKASSLSGGAMDWNARAALG